MKALIQADVPDIGSGNTSRRRLACLVEDRETIVVASQLAGDELAETELAFTLGDAQRLAEAVFSGDRRAVTTPGLARKLSAFALVLSRVCRAANAFQAIEGFDEPDAGYLGDQPETGGDESGGD